MASRRRCKSRVTADAAAAILNNWDSSCSEQSDSDLDSDFDVGKWDCNSSSDWELTITSTREVVATTNAATGRSLGRTAGGSTSRVTTRPKRSDGAGSKQKNAKRIKKTSASNPTSNTTTNTVIHSDDVDSEDAVYRLHKSFFYNTVQINFLVVSDVEFCAEQDALWILFLGQLFKKV